MIIRQLQKNTNVAFATELVRLLNSPPIMEMQNINIAKNAERLFLVLIIIRLVKIVKAKDGGNNMSKF